MIFTDSQTALKALESVTVKSKLVLECLECLSELETHNSQGEYAKFGSPISIRLFCSIV